MDYEDSVAAIEIVMRGLKAGSEELARQTLVRIIERIRSKDDTESLELRALALYNLAEIHTRLKSPEEARKSREEADSQLVRITAPGTLLQLEDQLALKLIQMEKHSQALPFCLQSIKLSGKVADMNMAIRLWRVGQCFLRGGFHEHAETPLRKALEIFRVNAGDPRMPVLLLELGNSLRRRHPRKAYAYYREAAAIWESAQKLEQAAAVWHNLGLVCADDNRLTEALDWYGKARKIREADTAAPPVRLGSLCNNIANVYRKMGDFARAHLEIRHALTLLEPAGGPSLASAYGSLGLIYRDEGADEEALLWFHKARINQEKQPNPDLANLTEKLENEAAALKRLGRLTEAAALDIEITRLRQLKPQGELPDLGSLKIVQPRSEWKGMVLIDLDGKNLADEVYEKFDLSTLEDRLAAAIEREGVGEWDGNEIGLNSAEARIFLYGPDAEELFRVIEPILRNYPLCEGARVRISQDSNEREIVITPNS